MSFVFVGFLIYGMATCDSTSSNTAKVAPKAIALDSSVIGGPRPMTADAAGCSDKEGVTKLHVLASQGDDQAFRVALAQNILQGTCILFHANDPVYVSDYDLGSLLLQVHRKGDPQEFWVPSRTVLGDK